MEQKLARVRTEGLFADRELSGVVCRVKTSPLFSSPSICSVGGIGTSPDAEREQPRDSVAQPLGGPARPRYDTSPQNGSLAPAASSISARISPLPALPRTLLPAKTELKPLSIRIETVGTCSEVSLLFLLDQQLSAELEVIHSRLLNGTPRKRHFFWEIWAESRIPGAGSIETGSKAEFFLLPVSREVENARWKMTQCKAGCGKELSDRVRVLGESLISMENCSIWSFSSIPKPRGIG